MENKWFKETKLMDYSHQSIQQLIQERGWNTGDEKEKITRIYNFVKDDILFGYNEADSLSASKILADGYGQCNTKSILLMTLLRAVGIPSRIHGFFINKSLQRGVFLQFSYLLAPKELVHSWAEVYYNGQWYALEGVILDAGYLNNVLSGYTYGENELCSYAVAINDFENNEIEWNENNTYIQKDAITKDLGVFQSPDKFFEKYQQNLNKFENYIYQNIIRRKMNKIVDKIRVMRKVEKCNS